MDEHADEHTYIAWMNFQNILSKRSWKKDHILYESTSGRYSEQANLFFLSRQIFTERNRSCQGLGAGKMESDH